MCGVYHALRYHAGMTSQAIDNAARHLIEARRQRKLIHRLPEECRPETNEDALAIQQRVLALMGDSIGGWKCAMPKGDNPFLAPLPGSTIRRGSSSPIVPSGRGLARIEPEVAFVIGKDLAPRPMPFSEAEVRDAVSEARLILELIGSRYVDPNAISFPESLADSINNQGFVIGPIVAAPFEQNLEALKIRVNGPSGMLVTHEGRHPAGHPLRPLVWFADFLSSRGETLKAGWIVTTGSYAGVLEVPMNTPLSVSFGALGKLDVTFSER